MTTSGSINLTPAAGQTDIESSELHVITNCKVGYSLTLSTSTNDNKLYLNGNTENDNEHTRFTPSTGITPLKDAPETWGYLESSTPPTENNIFNPVPAATDPVILRDFASTISEQGIDESFRVYYGASTKTDTIAGLYTLPLDPDTNAPGTLSYYLTANPYCTGISIDYNENLNGAGESGTDDSLANFPTENDNTVNFDSLTLSDKEPTRDNYFFDKWNTEPDGSGVSFFPGDTVTISESLSGNVTLYAIWEADTNELQNWTGCKRLQIGDTTTLIDTRDNTSYTVGKLQDNRCWLLDNLALDLTDPSVQANLNSTTTNATDTTLNHLLNGDGSTADRYPTAPINNEIWTTNYSQEFYSIPMIETSGSCADAYCVNDPSSGKWTSDSITQETINGETSYSQGRIGVYYNYCAASAGYYCFGDGTSDTGSPSIDPDTTTVYDVKEDVCPAGWRLPTAGSALREYGILFSAYNNNAENIQKSLHTSLAGYFDRGLARDQGRSSILWSSTWQNTDEMQNGYIRTGFVQVSDMNFRFAAASIRCVYSHPNHRITVDFGNNASKVTFNNDFYGTVVATTDNKTVLLREGIPYTITATDASGHTFAGWATTSKGILNSTTTNPTTYTISNVATLTVLGTEIPTHTVTVNFDEHVRSVGFYNAIHGTRQVVESGTDINLYDNIEYMVTASYEPNYVANLWTTDPNGTILNNSTDQILFYKITNDTTLSLASRSSSTLQDFRCISLSIGGEVNLTDTRDGTSYRIGRLADGNCWMLDNFALDLTDPIVQANLNSETTNATDESISYLLGKKSRDPIQDPLGKYATTPVSTVWNNVRYPDNTDTMPYSDPRIITSYKDDIYTNDTSIPESNTWKRGVYYNYCAATAGSYCYGYGTQFNGAGFAEATEDICPKGWKIPTGNHFGEYSNLIEKAIMHTPTYNHSPSRDEVIKYRKLLHLNLGGQGYGSTIGNLGERGWWLATSSYSPTALYNLATYAESTFFSSAYNTNYSYNLRCIFNQPERQVSIDFTEGIEKVTLSHPTYGTQTATPDNPTVLIKEGIDYNLTAIISSGYRLSSWSTNETGILGSTTEPSTVFSVVGDATLSAISRVVQSHEVTINFDEHINSVGLYNSEYGTQQITESGTTIILREETAYGLTASFESGYGIKKWLVNENATISSESTSSSNLRIYGDTILSITSELVDSTNSMQSFTSTDCNSLPLEQNINLFDSRDSNKYTIAKLADGNCWMLDNLALDLTDQSVQANLNSSTTNASDSSINYLIGNTSRNPATDPDGRYATSGVDILSNYSYSDPRIYTAFKDKTNLDDTLNEDARNWQFGIYYNYCAAKAGSFCYGNGPSRPSVEETNIISEDICPAGWRLPTGNYGKEFNTLYNNESYHSYSQFRNAFHSALTGYTGSDEPVSIGTMTEYWASDNTGPSSGYVLTVYNTDDYQYISAGNNSSTYRGNPIRCVYSLSNTLTVNMDEGLSSISFFNAIYGTQTVTSSNETVQLYKNVNYLITATTKNGHIFTGWTTSENASIKSTTENTTIFSLSNDATLSATSGAGEYMQDFTSKKCQQLPLSENTTLYDKRDFSSYTVARLQDNLCWMTSDLHLGSTTNPMSLTSETTDITSSFTLPRVETSSTKTQWGTNNSTSGLNTAHAYQFNAEKHLYNWYTATAGTSYNNNSSTNSICPKGWKLPTKAQADAYLTSRGVSNGTTNTSVVIDPPLSFTNGYYSSTTQTAYTNKVYWLADGFRNTYYYGYYFGIRYSSNIEYVQTSYGYQKMMGLGIRCVLAPQSHSVTVSKDPHLTEIKITDQDNNTQTITSSNATINLRQDAAYTIEATPEPGYQLASWSTGENGTLGSTTDNPTTFVITGSTTLSTSSSENLQYAVTVNLDSNISSVGFYSPNYPAQQITTNGETVLLYRNINYVITATSQDGYWVKEWSSSENGFLTNTTNRTTNYKVTGPATLTLTSENSPPLEITYQGNGLTFDNETTTNLVTYNATKTIGNVTSKYSHTSNIDDTGVANGNYSNSLATKDVITIPNATNLEVTIYYSTEANWDYVYAFTGTYTGSVSKNMSAGQLKTYNGGAKTTFEQATQDTFTVTGDTVTFAFYSDGSSAYYGYYAIVTGYDSDNNPISIPIDIYNKTVANGIYKVPTSSARHDFLGWSTDPNANTATYTNETDIITNLPNINGDAITLYAIYTKYLTIHYDGNGSTNGSLSDTEIKEQSSAVLRNNTFTRDNHTYNGWNTEPDGSGTSYLNQQVYTATYNLTLGQEITLYAQWLEHKTITVHFDEHVTSVGFYNSTYGTQQVTEDGATVTINENTPYIITASYAPHYGISNWSITEEGNLDNTTTTTTTLTVTGNATLTLASSQIGSMADFTTSSCANMDAGDTVYLYDPRDDSNYYVGKLADGNCWMLDNLALDLTNTDVKTNLTSATTNASDTTLNYLKNGGGSTDTESEEYKYAKAGVANWTSSYSYSNPLIYTNSKNTIFPAYGKNNHKAGIYYNYCAASAGSYCFGDGTSPGTSTGNMEEDICPAGWRIPTGGNVSGNIGNYQALYTTYSNNVNDYRNALSFALSGYYYNGSIRNQNSQGYAWSSTYSSANYMYSTYVYSNMAYPSSSSYRYYGLPVRCRLRTAEESAPMKVVFDGNGLTFDNDETTNTLLYNSVNPTSRTLSSGTYAIPTTNIDYDFLGWSTDPNAIVATYLDDTDIITNLPGYNGDTITLYAIWMAHRTVTVDIDEHVTSVKFYNSIYGEQEVTEDNDTIILNANVPYVITSSFAAGYGIDAWTTTANGTITNTALSTTTYTITDNATLAITSKPIPTIQSFTQIECNAMNNQEVKYLYDSRDNTTYGIVKYLNQCWTQENLRLDLTNINVVNALTPENTNASAASLVSLRSGNRENGEQYATEGLELAEMALGPGSFTSPKVTTRYQHNTYSDDQLNDESKTWEYGIHYNYCAMTAGSYCYDEYATSPIRHAIHDICPAGWRLPTGGTNSDYSKFDFHGDFEFATTIRNTLHLSRSGLIGGGTLYNSGNGFYLSSTIGDNGSINALNIPSYNISVATRMWRAEGFPVRCVLRSTNDTHEVTININSGIHSIAFFNETYGTVTATSENPTVNLHYNTPYIVTATLKNNATFVSWQSTEGGNLNSPDSITTTYTIKNDTILTAKPDLPLDTVTLNLDEHITSIEYSHPDYGTEIITNNGSTIQLRRNEEYTFTAHFEEGYITDYWNTTENGILGNNTESFTTTYQVSGSSTLSLHSLQVSYMQNTEVCDTMSVGDTTKLVDSRDNNTYKISKLADNNCWMIENLKLDPADSTIKSGLNSINTNATDTTLNYFKNGGTSPYTTNPVSKAWSNTYTKASYNISNKDIITSSDGNGNGKTGGYYNFCTATAGSYCYADGSGIDIADTLTDAPEDICPAGWRLPTGSTNSSSNYQILYDLYSNNLSDFQNVFSPTYAGYYNSNINHNNAYGYWSSTFNDASRISYLQIEPSGIDNTWRITRNSGFPIRCVIKYHYAPATIDFSDPNLESITFTDPDNITTVATPDNNTLSLKKNTPYTITASLTDGYTINTWSSTSSGIIESINSNPTTYTITNADTITSTSSIKVSMQSFTPSTCDALSIGDIIKLYDTRDNSEYRVSKLEDGRCWMLDNLALDLANDAVLRNMSEDNTDATNTSLQYLTGISTGTTSDQYATSAVVNWPKYEGTGYPYSYSFPMYSINGKDDIPADDSISNTGDELGKFKSGGYYNYCAASAGSYCYGDGNTTAGTSSGNSKESICPKGWRMPTGGEEGEYQLLANSITGSSTTNLRDDDYISYRTSLRLPLSGYYYYGYRYSSGVDGFYWASTRNTDLSMDIALASYIHTANDSLPFISPTSFFDRGHGLSIRCILNKLPTATVDFSDPNITSVTFTDSSNKTTTATPQSNIVSLREDTPYTVTAITTGGYTLNTWSTSGNGSFSSTTVNPTTYTIQDHDTITPSSIAITTMQSFTANTCESMNVGDTLNLFDSRDNTGYTISKLPDNKCWMLDNLALDLTDPTVQTNLNSTTTNASNSTLNYLKGTSKGTTSDQFATSAVSNSLSNSSYSDPIINTSEANTIPANSSFGKGKHKTGVYYNYCAASAGSYCFGNSTASPGAPSGNAEEDICPTSWRLPTGGNNGEYRSLCETIYGSSCATNQTDNGEQSGLIYQLSIPLSGAQFNGKIVDHGTEAGFWTSTRPANHLQYDMNRFQITSNTVISNSLRTRDYGLSIRCVFDPTKSNNTNTQSTTPISPSSAQSLNSESITQNNVKNSIIHTSTNNSTSPNDQTENPDSTHSIPQGVMSASNQQANDESSTNITTTIPNDNLIPILIATATATTSGLVFFAIAKRKKKEENA